MYNGKPLESFKNLSDRTQFTLKKTNFAVVWRMGWMKAKLVAERPIMRLLLYAGKKWWWPKTGGSSVDRESGSCVTGAVDVGGGGNLGEWWVGKVWGCSNQDCHLGLCLVVHFYAISQGRYQAGHWRLKPRVRYKFEDHQHIHSIWSQDHNFQVSFSLLSFPGFSAHPWCLTW